MYKESDSRRAKSPVGTKNFKSPRGDEYDRFEERDRVKERRSDSYYRHDRVDKKHEDRYDDERKYRSERDSRGSKREYRRERDRESGTDDRRKERGRPSFKYKPGQEHFDDPNVTSRYKYIRYLSHGSYGWVCEAECMRSKKRVAIKKVAKIFDNAVNAKRLLRELRILRCLGSHEAIIDVKYVIPPDDIVKFDSLCIVFEFVDTDLAKLIASKQYFTTLHVEHMLHQLLLGLKFMHSANVAHRDIKPANILVSEKCSLKICDFGLARGFAENHNEYLQNSRKLLFTEDDGKEIERPERKTPPELTRHVVTRWYRAPEVILLQQEREWLLAVDMWAVGCITAELLEMIKETCPEPADRKPLFPGASSFPLSADDHMAYKDSKDQLNVIFEIIGTPSRSEIQNMRNVRTREYLQSLPKQNPIDLRKRFPGASAKVIDLLKGLLRFNYRKRLTVEQTLAHKFFKQIRDKASERRHKKILFEFEDVPMNMRTIKELIIDEILFWNIALTHQFKRSRDRGRRDRRDKLLR